MPSPSSDAPAQVLLSARGADAPGRGDAAAGFVVRASGWILAVCGAIGLIAAFTLTVERLRLAEDPDYIPTCSINPILSCGSVMTTPQAEAFGVPNPLLGIAGFAALTALAVAVLSGATLARGLWLTLQAGLTFAVGFVHWLFFQSVYRIDALCPYCIAVWIVTIAAFLYCTLRNLATGAIPLPRRATQLAATAIRYHGVLLTLWLAILTGLVAKAFWYYWRTLL